MSANLQKTSLTGQRLETGAVRHLLTLRYSRGERAAMNKDMPDRGGHDYYQLMRSVAADRDVAAFEIIFKDFAPRVKAYMLRLTSDRMLAEELMQEAMVAVWKKAELYDPSKGTLSSWIFRIARNLRIDALRREKRPEFSQDDPALVPDDVVAADEGIVRQQSAEILKKAMEALPSEQLSLLKMSFYDDFSQSEIAETMNIPLGTVKSRMRLAVGKLRAALSRTGGL
jgi:RNA polymerase sigma factor (sigma-70 family)